MNTDEVGAQVRDRLPEVHEFSFAALDCLGSASRLVRPRLLRAEGLLPRNALQDGVAKPSAITLGE